MCSGQTETHVLNINTKQFQKVSHHVCVFEHTNSNYWIRGYEFERERVGRGEKE